MSERVLVTGASGFIGAPLVEALARKGKTVRVAVRRPGAMRFAGGIEVVRVPDFNEAIDWKPILSGVGSVVHLAGIAHVGPRLDQSAYDRVVYGATAELARACGEAGVRRLVFLSSVRAQSSAAAVRALRETDAPHPTEAYGRAKLKAEAAIRSSRTSWAILRPPLVYGRGVKGNLASLIRIANSPWPLPLASFKNLRSLVSLENVIAAITFALDSDAAVNETFLVADPTPLTLAEIVVALRRGAGRPPRLFPLPPALLAAGLKALGRGDVWERLGGSLVVDPGKLIAAGWHPDPDTRSSLARMAAAALRGCGDA